MLGRSRCYREISHMWVIQFLKDVITPRVVKTKHRAWSRYRTLRPVGAWRGVAGHLVDISHLWSPKTLYTTPYDAPINIRPNHYNPLFQSPLRTILNLSLTQNNNSPTRDAPWSSKTSFGLAAFLLPAKMVNLSLRSLLYRQVMRLCTNLQTAALLTER